MAREGVFAEFPVMRAKQLAMLSISLLCGLGTYLVRIQALRMLCGWKREPCAAPQLPF